MYRTFIILRHTFWEAVLQPIYPLLIALATAVLMIFTLLPFFTFDEDTVMFKDNALDIILLAVLVATLFATSKSIYEEIEDRTMLTLMSKPLRKWEVLAGKYLGIVAASLLAVAVLGVILGLCLWWRIPADYRMNARSLDDLELQRLAGLRWMHLAGLMPSLVLLWMQIAALAAVGVALSTRLSLVVNLPLVIIIYVAGNLTRFLFPVEGQSLPVKVLAYAIGSVLPYLQIFDLKEAAVYRTVAVAQFANDPRAVSLAELWGYVAAAGAYAAVYVFFALCAGLWLFHNRELGGAEG